MNAGEAGDKVRIREGTSRPEYRIALGIGVIYRVSGAWADVQWDGTRQRTNLRHHKIKNLELVTEHETPFTDVQGKRDTGHGS